MTRVSLIPLHAVLSLSVVACAPTDADGDKWPAGQDCDDANPAVNPGAPELCGDQIDNNCDGSFSLNCADDVDGDGALAAEDCNDADPDVFPGAFEDCNTPVDDNCDGVVTECVAPTMIYDPVSGSPTAPYATAVYADQVVFGEPGAPGDGDAYFFEVEPGRVNTNDAVSWVAGEAGAGGAMGISFTRVSSYLCAGAEYFDSNGQTDVGKTYCFDEAAIRTANGSFQPSDAAFSVVGSDTDGFSHVLAITDADGDALDDLIVYTSRGVRIVVGDGSGWSGDYDLLTDATITLGSCDASDPIWCGYGRAALLENPKALLIAGDGEQDTLSWFDLPLSAAPYLPDATLTVPRAPENASSSVLPLSGFAVGNTDDRSVTLVDGSRTATTLQGAGPFFGHWVDEGVDQEGHPLLAVSDPFEPSGAGQGRVYIFDLDLTPLPTDVSQARYILQPPQNFIDCGWRTDIGTVTDDEIGTRTVVSSTCLGTGGAVYELDLVAPAAPPPPPQSITQTGARRFEIDQQVVDTYISRLEWIQSLAQTKMVTEGNQIVGWQLSGVDTGSVVDRLGLRDGDIVQTVNGQALTTRGVVRDVAWGLRHDTFFVLDILRNGNAKRYRYSIVP